jgi:dTDP-4-dehydrorhamnose 3,5-epimerase
MKISPLSLSGLLTIEPRVFHDDRGYFFESFNEASFRLNTGLNLTFVQDNQSFSCKNAMRGLHFQVPPKSQAKLIQVVTGSILDVVVDLRRSSPTFGQHLMIELKASDFKFLFVPEGFAHGFLSLEDNTLVKYKCSQYYAPDAERCLHVADESLKIEWPIDWKKAFMSPKDTIGLSLKDCSDFFI